MIKIDEPVKPPRNNTVVVGTKTIGKFYNKLVKTTLADDFYRNIIELETEIQLSQCPSMDKVKELASLYKKAIEIFSGVSNKKIQFYSVKLTKLLLGANKLSEKKNKPKTKWSQYMNSHKKNSNKFMLFIQVETSKQVAQDLLNNKEKIFKDGFEKIKNNLDEQKQRFLENKKKKKSMKIEGNKNQINEIDTNNKNVENLEIKEKNKNNSIVEKLKGRNEILDASLNDFMKKFHYIYLHSKLFELPIEKLNEILENTFDHKIARYYYYQDQIKPLKLMLTESGGDEHNEDISFLIKDLQNEKKYYYMALENLILESCSKIKTCCAEATVEEDKNMKKYLDELLCNLSKIFI